MFGLFNRPKRRFRDELHAITELDQSVRFAMYLELSSLYKKELEPESASVLAIQVTNYLHGDDFSRVYESLKSDVRSKVDSIRHLIEPKAAEVMTNNTEIREVVVRFIMTTYLIYGCLFDKEWLDKPEMKSRQILIHKFGGNGNDIPDSEDFARYIDFAMNFVQKRRQSM
jgi:hypothetical protein